MNFSLRCPKCGSADIHLYEDRSGIGTAAVDSRILSCRCGKQVFGRQIDVEIAKQKDIWKKGAPERKAQEREIERQRVEQERIRAEAHKLAATKRKQAEALRVAQEAANRRWIEGARRAQKASTPVTKPDRICAWKDCDNLASETSKYCCRACSNANARWRYACRLSQSALKGRAAGPSA